MEKTVAEIRWNKTCLAGVMMISAALCVSQVAAHDDGGDQLEDVHRVAAGIYRSPQPEASSFPCLAELGIRTVVSLRSEPESTEEQQAASGAGVRLMRIELRGFGRPKDESIREILSTITDEENQPALVHCKRGADRTGVVVACYRIGYQGWSIDDAMAEAKKFGLGWWQFGMKRFIRDSCGAALQ